MATAPARKPPSSSSRHVEAALTSGCCELRCRRAPGPPADRDGLRPGVAASGRPRPPRRGLHWLRGLLPSNATEANLATCRSSPRGALNLVRLTGRQAASRCVRTLTRRERPRPRSRAGASPHWTAPCRAAPRSTCPDVDRRSVAGAAPQRSGFSFPSRPLRERTDAESPHPSLPPFRPTRLGLSVSGTRAHLTDQASRYAGFASGPATRCAQGAHRRVVIPRHTRNRQMRGQSPSVSLHFPPLHGGTTGGLFS